MKKAIMVALGLLTSATVMTGCHTTREETYDATHRVEEAAEGVHEIEPIGYAQISLQDGRVIKGKCTRWRVHRNGMVTAIIDGKCYETSIDNASIQHYIDRVKK